MVLALANEMASGALAVSHNGRPDPEQSKQIVVLLSEINRKLRDVMQGSVQLVRRQIARAERQSIIVQ